MRACMLLGFGLSVGIAASAMQSEARGLNGPVGSGSASIIQVQDRPAAFTAPEQPLPANGTTQRNRQGSNAPFRILTSGDSNYLVRLYDVGSSKPVLSVFVRAGQTADLKVPFGTFEVKYAAGRKWYGYQHLFGPDASYSKANQVFHFRQEGNQIKGYSITLYAVPHGNLTTSRIDKRDF